VDEIIFDYRKSSGLGWRELFRAWAGRGSNAVSVISSFGRRSRWRSFGFVVVHLMTIDLEEVWVVNVVDVNRGNAAWQGRGVPLPSPLVGEGGLARSAKTDEGCWKE
jgi:hypothetical protein